MHLKTEHLFFFHLVYKIPHFLPNANFHSGHTKQFKTEQKKRLFFKKSKLKTNWIRFKNNKIVPRTIA